MEVGRSVIKKIDSRFHLNKNNKSMKEKIFRYYKGEENIVVVEKTERCMM